MAGYKQVELSKQQITALNNSLRDLELIKEDLERALAAGVPHCDELSGKCDVMKESIVNLKGIYAKGK